MTQTTTIPALLGALFLIAVSFAWQWIRLESANPMGESRVPRVLDTLLGFAACFFDALGIGNFASTTAALKLLRRMPDENIPGTLNVGYALTTVTEALIFIAVVSVDIRTLLGMIFAAVLGAWFGAGLVSRAGRRLIQIGMGIALLVAAALFLAANLHWMPGGGEATGFAGSRLVVAIAANFILGALNTLGVGMYAPCLIMVSLMGLSPLAAFPIMMGSCAFLMPIAGVRFIRTNRYSARVALAMTIGGIPGVLIAAFIVKSLPMLWLRWLVLFVVLYAGLSILYSARSRPPVGERYS